MRLQGWSKPPSAACALPSVLQKFRRDTSDLCRTPSRTHAAIADTSSPAAVPEADCAGTTGTIYVPQVFRIVECDSFQGPTWKKSHGREGFKRTTKTHTFGGAAFRRTKESNKQTYLSFSVRRVVSVRVLSGALVSVGGEHKGLV